ncbi:hypothetical protein [Patulibacter defluvii]|nr:hypothetical protein [Patulibacter sp. DM4]
MSRLGICALDANGQLTEAAWQAQVEGLARRERSSQVDGALVVPGARRS